MGLFDKKNCSICGGTIKLLGNRKLADGNMCKNCAAKMSPYMSYRKETVQEIIDHLAYREENKELVKRFNPTLAVGDRTKVLIDEDNGTFIVTTAKNWRDENPDVINCQQVTGCNIDLRENKSEERYKNSEGQEVSFNPPRYKISYDFYITILINSPWFSEIKFQLNDYSVDQSNAVKYGEYKAKADEMKEALTKNRAIARGEVDVRKARGPLICPLCGASTTPTPKGLCEYCGGAVH